MAGPAACLARQRLTRGNRQVGTLKKGLLRPRLSAIITLSRLPASHPDRRAVLIEIVALHDVAAFPSVIRSEISFGRPSVQDRLAYVIEMSRGRSRCGSSARGKLDLRNRRGQLSRSFRLV
jgi:hypothetical protein